MCGSVKVSDYQAIVNLMRGLDIPTNFRAEFEASDKLFPYFKPLISGFINTDHQKDSAMMNWGWRRDWDEGKRLFNSRRVSKKGQAISQSRVWGEAIRKRRCVIPVNAFYEWDQNQPKGKRDRYRVETNQEAFNLGAIYEISQEGEMFFSICTTEPNEQMGKIHHRMPVIIDIEETEQWLESEDINEVDRLMKPKPNDYVNMNKESEVGKTQSLF